MRVELTARRLTISPGLRTLIDRKLGKVRRVLNDDGVSAAIVVTREKINNRIELTLHARGKEFFHAVSRADTWETAVTDVVAKAMHHHTEKVKGKRLERKRRGVAARSVKTPREARKAVSRSAAPVTGGVPASSRRAPRQPRTRR